MTTTVTDIELANDALIQIGANKMVSFTESTRQAKLVNTFFTTSRRTVLNAYPWSFAKFEAVLSRTTNTPAIDRWDYEYQLPADMIRLVEVRYGQEYMITGKTLFSNEEKVEIYYIQDVENVPDWSIGFQDAFVAHLKWKMSKPFTQSGTATAAALDDYNQILRHAKSSDSQQKAPKVMRREPTGSMF